VSAALYPCEVTHARPDPVRNSFRYRGYLWFVDLDDLPRLPAPLRWLGGLEARDHLGDPALSIRANLDAYLGTQGVDLAGGRVTMLAAARVAGYVFNPLSVFWCHRPDGSLACVVAEVHNTYRQRHCYLLRPGADGTARTPKAFYVSPFEAVEGSYRMRLPEPAERLGISIVLDRPGRRPFTAGLSGHRVPLTAPRLLALALRYPLAPLVASLRIRRQGIALWLRGLAVVPRPEHHTQKAV
jgi:DUF1365 family protein